MILFGLLKFENKLSVVHFVLRRINQEDYNLPIKSKEKLIFHCGIRKFAANALFSQHTSGDKHKFERFMPDNGTFVSTVIAPISYPPASVLAYKELEDGSRVLVAVGSMLSVDPNRIILKRIVLSGYPYKVYQSKAVIRYMFFNSGII
jgi:pre-rRNA-processing protein TSR1